jgi:RNA polymerase primary sigma factor
MREMGTVDLLTHVKGINRYHKRIEGIEDVQHAMSYWPGTVRFVLNEYQKCKMAIKKHLTLSQSFRPYETRKSHYRAAKEKR